ncbi:cleavage polyadenylation factor subunit fip1 [Lignoscripta atroalba]|nr:cleavage polyadenylation factor subunit fip1 [Lignoscripta atroalba]
MDVDDDDVYAPDDGFGDTNAAVKKEHVADQGQGEEEGEEVEEDASDSDIDIITERKDDLKSEPQQPHRVTAIKNAPARIASPGVISKAQASPAAKIEASATAPPTRLGSTYPAIKTSNVDVDAKPIYEPNGKPITEIDMDADFPDDDKPWRRPGTDMTDYFNYGFDEFTWATYCLKQDSIRKEISDGKKHVEEMQSFLGMPGGMPAPGMPAPGAVPQPSMTPMGGLADMPPEFMQMMQQMMAQGIDPNQLDPSMMMQQMQQMTPGGQAGMNGNQGLGFGAGQGFGSQGQNQQQAGYGFGPGGGGGGAGGGGRSQGGRGQNRRNW